MHEYEDAASYLEDFQIYQPVILWPFLRSLVKIICIFLASIESYTEWPIDTTKKCFTNIGTCIEIPLLFPAALVGFIVACFTLALALTVLTIKSVWVFRKIAPSVVEALALRLWWEAKQSLISVFRKSVDYFSAIFAPVFQIQQLYRDSTSPPPEPAEPSGESDSDPSSHVNSESQGDNLLKTDFESLGGWKITENLQEPEVSVGDNDGLFIAAPQGRRHRRTGTGSSLRLSGASSPELVRTPLQMTNDSRERRRQRGSRSAASSPENYFGMTSRTNGSGSVAESSKHSRSGSSSTSSLRSAGKRST